MKRMLCRSITTCIVLPERGMGSPLNRFRFLMRFTKISLQKIVAKSPLYTQETHRLQVLFFYFPVPKLYTNLVLLIIIFSPCELMTCSCGKLSGDILKKGIHHFLSEKLKSSTRGYVITKRGLVL